MLSIKDLHARVEETTILKGLDLDIKPGEVHAIMGPNGAGKSTLGYVLSGREGYEVESGSVSLEGKDLLDMEVEERAQAGLFLAFQYPVEIPGVSNMEFMKESVNAMREARGEDALSSAEFLKKAKEACKQVELPLDFLKRGVNEGFSGGEKKRNEIMQMIMLEPKLAILDESDSGLDVDALQVVAKGVNSQRDGKRSFIVVTHYQRLLDYIEPDYVHILSNGKIVKSGGPELAKEVEKSGYAWLKEGEVA
ncbi:MULTISPECIES: Fe-S cluster assembly ATPase SufC [Idiomarina]|jgi:Fe-S cluster assembly ATP-binding protein|uniref:Fe-S cluster assembly ATPase SufC n=1 Tax=Idiomarina piscisalsi TaxID=1096243 RepID=A0A432YS63_9GAMM|nr:MULTISPECIES: Fe-S cluster assembly ATPase SufC [Idiomarina]MBF39771.1 Fe-S cluster assembly ATPase SufC [Idiomarinaceae bacterium]MCH2455036.1 Fe-S cluster assembly ATPase SufC [Idiomarina sp.]RUO64488.1 Fe-S cluster assembly ATPase SufC [Idiomarina piscisalsi]RXS43397.1 Fe-S cluster assembly ATPase SufC [Idiomarina sp. 29L]WPZ01468.1 Fe-S cluster assembly ATPase SufC [Idiomarina sp. OXR-189]|tara:strand:- start:27444 stop:28196 length:753 start_codon:yes stop_codon:yes gene_type:complete